MKKCVLIGSGGQLGYDLMRTAPDNVEVVGLTHADIEICDYEDAAAKLRELAPSHVVDLAAFHQTDVCEDEFEKTFAVNAYAPANLARVCQDIGAKLAYVSTDYVFSGTVPSPRTEADATDPVSVYGMSKRAGESMVSTYCEDHYIFRVSGLFGLAGASGKGGNFVETMIRLAKAGKDLKIVDDQTLSPTGTFGLAQKLWQIMADGPCGLYHTTGTGECNWFEFAKEIFRQMDLNPNAGPQSTEASGAKAKRPAYSVLDNTKLREAGFEDLPHWKDALNAYLVEKHGAAKI